MERADDRDLDGPTATVAAATTETAAEPVVPRARAAVAVGPASRIDRFLVLDKIGEGGMGTVFAAYDERLDRKVAVKVVRADRRSVVGGLSPRDRLLREAQAMARLSHPNVVSVLQVGELGDDVYVALEYVDGTTLKKWLRAERRTWRAVIDAFQQAGRGLAAAHTAGLVHRDFKPDNVLIRRDGRIQVIDFGIVSMGSAGGGSPGPGDPPAPCADHVTHDHTYAGLRVGTPAYMAPEQHAGEAVDPRADQFAFCVALWEALYGQRPFVGADPEQLAESMRRGEVRPPPDDAKVPRWLEAPLRRGLRADPAERWPSLVALLDELARDPDAARRRTLARAGGAAALVAAGVVAFLGWTRATPARSPCQGAERHLDGRWDAARANQLRRAFAATGLPYQAAAAAGAVSRLDAWSREWVAMHAEACAATRVHGEQSEALLDARMRCLDRRLQEVDELATVLATGASDVVARAIDATAALPSLAACADRDALVATVPPPSDPAQADAVAALQQALAQVRAQEQLGRYPAALAQARDAASRAEAVGYAPVLAEALHLRGRLELQTGELTAARATLERAAERAGATRQDDLLARTLIDLVTVLADQARGGEALAVGAVAWPAVRRAADPTTEGELRARLGKAHEAAGDLAAAERELRAAAAALEAQLGPDHIRVASALHKLGALFDVLGRADDARGHYERTLRIAEQQLGAAHPSTAVTRANLCYLDAAAGRIHEARACQEQVIATLEAALGGDHPQVAWALNDAGLYQQQLGDDPGARARFERALAIWEARLGPDHPDLAWPLVNLGTLDVRDGAFASGEARCRRALQIVEAAAGPDHPDTSYPLACVGVALAGTSPRDAVAPLRRALRLWEATPADPASEAGARFALARALAGIDRAGAVAEARRAEALLAGLPEGVERDELAEVQTWLRRTAR